MADMGRKQQGLTLIELMVTLAVAIILITVGMPMFTGMAANNRATTQANTFLSALKLARSEAVKRATEVSVCAVADPDANPVICGTSADWGNGLLVFTDTATAGVVDGTDQRIKVFAIPNSAATADADAAFVSFEAMGDGISTTLTNKAECPWVSGFARTCFELGHDDTTGTPSRCVYVNERGQVRLERAACS
jgi:type IV fimbrial biogenesis protein FimT